MHRKFGIELEVNKISQQKAASALRAVGLSVVTPGYTHATSTSWKIVPDGSVPDGFEVVSPVLEGQAGLDAACAAINALKAAGAKANRACGMHVHVDAQGLDVNDLRSIVSRYAKFEEEIDAFMPPSRRGDGNIYCHTLRNFASSNAFRTATNVQELARAQNSRYYKVNLQSLHRHGTIEFRQHNGIVDADRAINWIKMLDAFIGESVRLARETTEPETVQNAVLIPSQQRVVEMLQQGITNANVIATRLGVQGRTLRACITRIRQAGIPVNSNRVNGTTFYGLAAVPQAARQTSDTLWNGIDAVIATFYRNRAAVLALS